MVKATQLNWQPHSGGKKHKRTKAQLSATITTSPALRRLKGHKGKQLSRMDSQVLHLSPASQHLLILKPETRWAAPEFCRTPVRLPLEVVGPKQESTAGSDNNFLFDIYKMVVSCSFWPGLYNLSFSIVQPVQAKKKERKKRKQKDQLSPHLFL